MGRKRSKVTRKYGMSWEEILQYDSIIRAIAMKYSKDDDLAADIAQEVRLKLHSDKRLDTSKFDPNKKDAAIRTTIRNKTIKALKSKGSGRSRFESLDKLQESGLQVNSSGFLVTESTVSPKIRSDIYEQDLDRYLKICEGL